MLLACVLAAGACSSSTVLRVRRPTNPPPLPSFGPGEGVQVNVPPHHSHIGVVVLHSLSHGVAELIAQGWNQESDRHGFVAIYPTRGTDWNAGLCCGAAAADNRDDVTWLTELIAAEKSKYGLSQIYLAGNSNGGMMVERLVAEDPGLTNRFAIWAAAPEMPKAGHWSGDGFLFRGSRDTTIPPGGGTITLVGRRTIIRPVATTNKWLIGAHLTTTVVTGQTHATPPGWAATAWSALSSGS